MHVIYIEISLDLPKTFCVANRKPVGREIYYHGNHPIKWVRITGVIIAVDEFYARRVFTIDDSSGVCIECTCPAPLPSEPTIPSRLDRGGSIVPVTSSSQTKAPTQQASTPSVDAPLIPWDEMDVGVVVKIKGKPNTFRDTKQVDIIKAEVIRGTEQEVRCWNEVLAFRKDVLRVPWVVSPDAEARFKKRAERGHSYRHSSKKHARSTGRENSIESKVGSKYKSRVDTEGLQQKKTKLGSAVDGLKPDNKANYPSFAVRKKLAGKYDALGI